MFTLPALLELEAAGPPDDMLVVAAARIILSSVVLQGLAAPPPSAWCAGRPRPASGRRAEPVELAALRGRHRALVGTRRAG